MIARITGHVVEVCDRGLVLETGGIGYLIYSPSTALLGTSLTLFTHLIVREDCQELYGFEKMEEKALFQRLVSVSGVGPKTALQMLTLYPLGDLIRAIQSGDAKALSLVPGIGKKTAERVVIDLKDKLTMFTDTGTAPHSDLVEALLSLGYRDIQVRSVVGDIDVELPIEKQIMVALQLLQK
jgi:holliday junction DNA helicase RuvA